MVQANLATQLPTVCVQQSTLTVQNPNTMQKKKKVKSRRVFADTSWGMVKFRYG